MFDYKDRIRSLRTELENKECDAFITSFMPHLRYLTGFSGSNGLCIVTHTKVFFLTDFRYKEQIRNEVSCSRSFITSGELIEKAAAEKLLRGMPACRSGKRISFACTVLGTAKAF